MKLNVLAFWALALAILTGCTTAQLGLLQQRPLGIDQSVVEQLVCSGNDSKAEEYIELRGGSIADRVERIARAKQKAPHIQGCTPAK